MSKTYELTKGYSVTCDVKKPFTHVAVVYDEKYNRLNRASIRYYNRTWEQYNFQDVIHKAIDNCDGIKAKTRAKNKVDKEALGVVKNELSAMAGVVAFAGLLQDDPAKKTEAKLSALEIVTGGAVQRPDDWETLTEEVKQKRIDGAVDQLK